MKRPYFFLLAAAIAGCQQAMPISEPTLQQPQITTELLTQAPSPRPQLQSQSHPYQYLAPNLPRNPWLPLVQSRPWRWIVIHHSDTKTGSAASFDRYHKDVHHWDELGYDFVIGNGNGSGDGQVEVGPRWKNQKIGAHAGVKEYNEFGIGICLVGDFDTTRPTPAQMQSLARLTSWLMASYHIPPTHILGHRDCKHTNCPGRYMDLNQLRGLSTRAAATSLSNLGG